MSEPRTIATSSTPAAPRRSFLMRCGAVVIGGAITLFPFLAGLVVALDPLRRRGGTSREVKVAPLAAVPDDGLPRQFPVIYDTLDDAWTRYRQVPAGAVYLVRSPGSSDVLALHATCPHLGCFVDFLSDRQAFGCPCHKSTFDPTGVRTGGVSPRDMDRLDCQVRDGAVWVKFENFKAGQAEKVPQA